MPRLTRRPLAEEDLLDIWNFIAKDNPAAADRLLDHIDKTCNRLAANPNLGPARDDLERGLRYFVVRKYLILYRRTENGAEIVRIVHGARNLPDLF